MNTKKVRAFLIVGFIALFARLSAIAQPAGNPALSDWPSELNAAVALYRAGDYAAVQQFCTEWLANARDPRLRREASALAALAMLRSPVRGDRLDGRSRLVQAAQEDPTLLERPDCLLAQGIAQTTLNETTSALIALDQVVRLLAARPDDSRLAEAYAALAEAWARHNEWETTPERLVQRPAGPEQARVVRRERIQDCRARLEQLPNSADALTRVDWILARNFIEEKDQAEAGWALVERLVAAPRWILPNAEAALLLAERRAGQERWTDALALYERVGAGAFGELSAQAAQKAAEIKRPRIALELPAHGEAARKIPVRLRVRNVKQTRFEVRRMDLDGWLNARQGRLLEEQLPVTGAVLAARDLETVAAAAYGWWSSEAANPPLEFDAPPGAYVVLARAKSEDGAEHIIKQLLTVGDLRAGLFWGARQGLLWVLGDGAKPLSAEPTALFWMYGSFVPARIAFEGGVGRFALPADARVLQDRRWTCLVKVGEQVTLLRGQLAEPAGNDAPGVALIGSSSEPDVGQIFSLYGLLLENAPLAGPAAQEPLQVELRDATDRVICAQATPPTAGTFIARMEIPEAAAGRRLHVVVRRGERVLENVRGRFEVKVASLGEARPLVTCKMPAWLPPDTRQIAGEIEARYAWGTPAADAHAQCVLRAVPLTAADWTRAAVVGVSVPVHGELDAQGRLSFSVPLAQFELPKDRGPLAIGAWVTVFGWDGRQAAGYAETLIGPRPLHGWLTCEPPQPRAGEPLRFLLGWFDPGAQTVGGRPRLEIRQDGNSVAPPALYPTQVGYRSELWRPTIAGRYEIIATVPTDGAEPLVVRQNLEVLPLEHAAPTDAPLQCEARWRWKEGRFGVEARVNGSCARPLLALVEAGEPLAARELPGLQSGAELFLPAKPVAGCDARLLIVFLDAGGFETLAAVPVLPAKQDALELSVGPAVVAAAPGTTVEISVSCKQATGVAAGTMLLARLIDAADAGYVQWAPGETRETTEVAPTSLTLTASGQLPQPMREKNADEAPAAATQSFSPNLIAALFEGETLWLDSVPVQGGAARLRVPVPTRPGRYRLLLLARTPEGLQATDSIALDARGGVEILADVPRQLSLGDRAVVPVRFIHQGAGPLAGRAALHGGEGLHIETVRGAGATPANADSAAIALNWTGAGSAAYTVLVEAARVGEGVFEVEVETDGRRQKVRLPYRVEGDAAVSSAATKAAHPPLHVRRTLILMTPPLSLKAGGAPSLQASPFQEKGARSQHAAWGRTLLNPGDVLSPGQCVLVREEFSPDQPLGSVQWAQSLPAACQSPVVPPEKPQQIGDTRQDPRGGAPAARPGQLDFAAARLGTGSQTHEYFLTVLRPGVYRLPPPQVQSAGQPVPVEIEGGETRLRVQE